MKKLILLVLCGSPVFASCSNKFIDMVYIGKDLQK